MKSDRLLPAAKPGRPPSRRRAAALFAALAVLALPAAVAQGLSGGGAAEVKAARLARGLAAETEGLERLREPARTTQQQIGIALEELEQMRALAYDPHYLPALVAVGRASVAISGRDPVTGTVVSPEYTGLDEELGASASGLQRSVAQAQELRQEVRRLDRRLAVAERRLRRP